MFFLIVLFHLKLIENSFYVDLGHVDTIVEEINETDGKFFAHIFREDVVIVTRRTHDDQINKIFGLLKKTWQILPFTKNLGKFERERRFSINYVDEEGNLRKHTRSRILYEKLLDRLSNTLRSGLDNILSVITRTPGFKLSAKIRQYFSDEVFITKKGKQFVKYEFKNEDEKKIFCEDNKEKYFFFLDESCPASYRYVKKKVIQPNSLQSHYSRNKIELLGDIVGIITNSIKKTQANYPKTFFFYLFHKQFKNTLASRGIFIDLCFSGIFVTQYNLVLKPISYDKESFMLSYWLRKTDPWVGEFFRLIAINFSRKAAYLHPGDNKILWSSKYIDSVLDIFEKQALLKKKIDIGLFPEIISTLFPTEFFVSNSQDYSGNGLIRSVIDFSKVEELANYEDFFNDTKMKRIKQITNRFMSTFS